MNDLALTEIKKIRQREGEAKRRWLTSSQMDVFLWQEANGEIVGFHVTYDKPQAEKAISWRLGERVKSASVLVDGPNAGGHPGTPLLVANGQVDGWSVCGRLVKFSGELDGYALSTICRIIANAYGNRDA